MTVNYDSIVSALHTEVERPVLVGVGVWRPEGERYECCKHNDEAVLILKKNPSFPPDEASYTPAVEDQTNLKQLTPEVAEQPTGETHVSEDPVDPEVDAEDTSVTQAEAQQDDSLTDAGEEVFGVDDSEPDDPASNFVANEDFLVGDAERDEHGNSLVDDDYLVEVVAESEGRLHEITDWVNAQITGYVRASKPLSFEAVETTDNGKYACCAYSVAEGDEADDEDDE